MGAPTISELRGVPPQRYLLPAIVLLAPLLAYVFVSQWVVGRMTPLQPSDLSFVAREPGGKLPAAAFGQDITARYAIGIANSAFLICALAALALVYWRLAPRWGIGIAASVIAAVLLAGTLYELTPYQPIRTLVSQAMLDRIVDLKLTDPPSAPHHIINVITLSHVIGTAALAALVVRFADLAFHPSAAQSQDSLRARMKGFRNALLVSGLMLAFAVASAHAFFHYPAALMTEESAKDFQLLASTATTFWGTIYSGVLLLVALPCYAAIRADAEAVSAEHGGESHVAREEWLEKEGLTLAPRQAFASLLATAAPLLTGPALDLLQSLPV